jgi:hypothetical protein
VDDSVVSKCAVQHVMLLIMLQNSPQDKKKSVSTVAQCITNNCRMYRRQDNMQHAFT